MTAHFARRIPAAALIVLAAGAFAAGGASATPPAAPATTTDPAPELPIPGGVTVGPNGIGIPGVQLQSDGAMNITGDHANKVVACGGKNLGIKGNGNTITVTGGCGTLNISGTGNHVTVDSAGTITVIGQTNNVTYHSGKPVIHDTGSHDLVRRG